jgi:hypothetical protein
VQVEPNVADVDAGIDAEGAMPFRERHTWTGRMTMPAAIENNDGDTRKSIAADGSEVTATMMRMAAKR